VSHSTVDGIIAEVTNLRGVFRAALEDDKFTTTCTRRDLRTLLELFRDIFRELGTVRTTLNDIVLDPSMAPKVREMTLNPKDESSSGGKPLSLKPLSSKHGGGWMAPLSKLFGSSVSNDNRGVTPLGVNQGRGPIGAPSRPIPKLGPATSASTTTVNVEFTGTGAGRAVTHAATPIAQETTPHDTIVASVATRHTPVNIMGIFAGAPRNDSWIMLSQDSPRPTRASADQLRRATLRRTAGRILAATDETPSPLPRNVDAVIDPRHSPEERGGMDHAHTLHRRGLSDSSIRTTFLQHEEAPGPQPPETAGGQALSQKTPKARPTVSGTTSPPGSAKEPSQAQPRAASPRFTGLLPDMSSWAVASRALDDPDPDLYVGSVISNSPLRPWDRRGGEL
jgi:hypothetical protein